MTKNTTKRYCLFRNITGKEVAVHDDDNMPVTFATAHEAGLESLCELEEHIRQFKAGYRDYDGIMFQREEYVEEVGLLENGRVIDADGNEYGKRD